MTTGKLGMRTVIPMKGRVGKNLRERKNALGYIAKKAAQCRFNHLLAFFFLDAAFFLGRSGFSSSFSGAG